MFIRKMKWTRNIAPYLDCLFVQSVDVISITQSVFLNPKKTLKRKNLFQNIAHLFYFLTKKKKIAEMGKLIFHSFLNIA